MSEHIPKWQDHMISGRSIEGAMLAEITDLRAAHDALETKYGMMKTAYGTELEYLRAALHAQQGEAKVSAPPELKFWYHDVVDTGIIPQSRMREVVGPSGCYVLWDDIAPYFMSHQIAAPAPTTLSDTTALSAIADHMYEALPASPMDVPDDSQELWKIYSELRAIASREAGK